MDTQAIIIAMEEIGGDQTGGYGLYYGFYYSSYCGQGGTLKIQVGQEVSSGGSSGAIGIGGNAYATYGGGGGGGGYYGGGGGYYYGGGGGGSNYYNATGTSNISTFQGYTTGNGQIIISWNAISCASATRSTVTLTVNSISSPPSNALASPSSIICGDVSNFKCYFNRLYFRLVHCIYRWYEIVYFLYRGSNFS